ncbi:MAG: phosphoribosyltransferase [Anaerobiospirillum sp.]|nr:phosphoribosyltransferase [Anaerobiospirillum sp.]
MESTICDVHFEYFDYYPSSYIQSSNPNVLLSEPKLASDNIKKFKQGIGQEWPIELVENSINNLGLQEPNVDKSNIAFVCLPASKKANHEARFKNFSESICKYLGIQNGFDHLTIINEKDPKYSPFATKRNWNMESDLQFDSDFFEGKKVILFDDIVTSGDSMRAFIYKLRSLGAKPVLCMSLLYTPKIF